MLFGGGKKTFQYLLIAGEKKATWYCENKWKNRSHLLMHRLHYEAPSSLKKQLRIDRDCGFGLW